MESACVNDGCVETCVKIEAAICVRDIPQDQPNNVLFVRAVPLDCSKREAAHIFRHFNGFKAMRFVKRKKKRNPTANPNYLCFVEFIDQDSARIAMDSLQRYKFDEDDSPVFL